MKIPIWSNLDDIDRSTLVGIIILVFAVVVIFLACYGTVMTATYIQCNQIESMDIEREYAYLIFGGCMVKSPQGYWVSIDDQELLSGGLNELLSGGLNTNDGR